MAEEGNRKENREMGTKQRQEDQEILQNKDREFFHKLIESIETTKVSKKELQVMMDNNRKETEEQVEIIIKDRTREVREHVEIFKDLQKKNSYKI